MRGKNANIIRRTTKYVYIIIAIILIAISSTSLSMNLLTEHISTQTKEIYNYTNKFDYSYNIKLLNNKYMFGETKNDGSIVYVTDLIDTTDFNLNYIYKGSLPSDIIYDYKIIGRTQIMYEKDGDEQKIWEEEETLLEQNDLQVTTDTIQIAENITLDLKSKNALLNEFKQEKGMAIKASYNLILKVNIKTTVEGEEIVSEYAPFVQMALAEKTSKITGENNLEDTEYVTKEFEELKQTSPVFYVIDGILLFIALILLNYVRKSTVSNKVKNKFKQELNHILKLCDDRIVKTYSRKEDDKNYIVDVLDFGEIVKVSEELFKPILYYYDEELIEADFRVISNEAIYRYILKKE